MNCPHCKTHIDEHPANRCFDAWVAIKLMGYDDAPFVDDVGEWRDAECRLIPYSTTDIAAAWEVHKVACNWTFSKRGEYFRELQRSVSAREYPKGQIAWPDVMLFLMPEDFCRAAIKAGNSQRGED